jgi:hypothetical protein
MPVKKHLVMIEINFMLFANGKSEEKKWKKWGRGRNGKRNGDGGYILEPHPATVAIKPKNQVCSGL